MVLVAVAAVGMVGWRMYKFRQEYLRKATSFEQAEIEWSSMIRYGEKNLAQAEERLSSSVKMRDAIDDQSDRQPIQDIIDEVWRPRVDEWESKGDILSKYS